MTPRPAHKPRRTPTPEHRPDEHDVPDDFDLLFEQYAFRNRGEDDGTYDIAMIRYAHGSGWTSLTRDQITFLRDRMDDFLADTAEKNHFVYMMLCGHTTSSLYRLSSQARAYCSGHGFQRLDPRPYADSMLPTWKEWNDAHSGPEEKGSGSH